MSNGRERLDRIPKGSAKMRSYIFKYAKDGQVLSFSVIAPSAIEAIDCLKSSVGIVDIRYLKSSPRRAR